MLELEAVELRIDVFGKDFVAGTLVTGFGMLGCEQRGQPAWW